MDAAGETRNAGARRLADARCAGAHRLGTRSRRVAHAIGEALGVREARCVRSAEGARAGRLRFRRQAEVMRALVFAALLLAGCRETPKPTTTASPSTTAPSQTASVSASSVDLKEGDQAPALVATASNGTKIDLAQLKGKHVVVFFYPKDDTPGCTKEACAFRDAWSKLEKGDVQVIGVSVDDDESHKKFAEKHKLPFPLIADPDKKICAAFGVPVNNGYASRVSFLIAPDGKIKKVYPKVDPAVHADEILAAAGVTS